VEVTTKKITKTKETADITASAEEIKPHIDKAYENFRAKIELKGFRKGKAPLSLIKKMYGEAIENDAINDVVNHLYSRAISEHNLKPVSEPVLKNVNYKPGNDFSFSVEYEVLPQIELQEYKNIQVEKPVRKVTDDMVEREIEGVRLNYATRSEVDSVTDEYHSLTVDIQELDEQGVAIIGKRSQDQTIDLFDSRYEKDFVTPLLNAERDGEYVIQYNHDHGDHKHSVHIRVTVKKIEKVTLPELDDNFVKDTFKGKFSSTREFHGDVRNQLQSMFDKESTRAVRNQIADEIVKRHDFPVPEALITNVFDQMIEDVKRRMPDQKLPPDFDRHAFEAEYYTQAEWQARWTILRDALFEAEHIAVDDKDIEARAVQDATHLGLGKDQIMNFYKTNHGIRDQIMHEKLMEVLESHASITEKEVTPGEREPQQRESHIIH
jgi:trigger factor